MALVCQEIKAYPGRGVDYFAGKERFEEANEVSNESKIE